VIQFLKMAATAVYLPLGDVWIGGIAAHNQN